MITLDLSILNQKGTPMFYSDIFANRPAAGVVGRIFISTDTYAIYRDTGSAWDQIGGSGSGITGSGTAGTLPIWTSSSALGDSSLLEGSTKISTIKDIQADGYYLTGMTGGSGALYWTSDRVTLANYNAGGIVHIEVNGGTASTIFGTDLSLTNYGYIAATPTLTATNNASSLASYGINTLSYAAGFSSNNIGALYGGMAAFNLQTFAGSATFAQANVASAMASINSIDFSSAGSTITMTQSSGIRVMSGSQSQLQYQGTNSGTITHAAISQNLGFYRPSGASGTLTITNAYSQLINALDDYGAGFSFTNRWGIYQAGASDKNYFAANVLLGSVVDNGNRLQVAGNAYIGNPSGDTRIQVQSTGTTGSSDVRLICTSSTVQYDWLVQGLGADGRFRIYDNAGTTGEWFTILQNGYVSIGNGNTPTSKLSVYESISGSSPNPILRLENSGPAYQARMILTDGNTSDGIIAFQGGFSSPTQYLGFGIGSSPTQMALTGEGKLGIGTLVPLANLDVTTTGNTSINITAGSTGLSRLVFGTTSGNNRGFIDYDNTSSSRSLIFRTDENEKMRLDASGNLSIGTTASSAKLFVSGVSSGISIKTNHTAAYSALYSTINNTSAIAIDNTSGAMDFYTNGGNFISRFSTSQNVLIGTTTDLGHKLQVNGNTYSKGLYVETGSFAAAGSTTTVFFTFDNLAQNRVFFISLRQQGASANSVIAIGFTYTGTLAAYNIVQENTNPSLHLHITSNGGLGLQLTTGSGYGTTTWEWTITQIK